MYRNKVGIARRLGFTLVEILVTLSLIVVLLAIAVSNVRSRNPGSVKEAAERVVEELRLARNQAVSTGEPVAFCITDGNDSPSFYLLAGRVNPVIAQRTNIAVDHKGVHISPVHWPGPALVPAENVDIPVERENFSFPQWNPPNPDDYCIVFLPSGAALNNKLAFGQSYHFLVSAGAASVSSNVSGVNSRVLTGVNTPYTISVTPAGLVSAEKGLIGTTGSMEDLSLAFVTGVQPAPPGAPSNSDPYDLTVEVFPRPNANVTSLGVDATVNEDGFLTLRATAIDDQSDQLRCVWTCSDNDGDFSYDRPMEMEWNGESNRWEAAWEWFPPVPDTKGVYVLSCEVIDGRGGSVTGLIPVNGQVMVLHEGQLVYGSDETGDWDVYTCNPDGTDITNLTKSPGSDQRDPKWSVDGRKIVYVSDESGVRQIYVMDSDGNNKTQISTGPGFKAWPSISSDGTTLVWSNHGVTNSQIWTSSIDGTSQQMIYDSAGVFTRIEGYSFHQNGGQILFSAGNPGPSNGWQDPGFEIWKIDTDGSNLRQLTNYPTEICDTKSILIGFWLSPLRAAWDGARWQHVAAWLPNSTSHPTS